MHIKIHRNENKCTRKGFGGFTFGKMVSVLGRLYLLTALIGFLFYFGHGKKVLINDGVDGSKEGKSVSVVDYNNFHKFMRKQPVLLEFYAPWCIHCAQFGPLYHTVADTLHAQASAGKGKPFNVRRHFSSRNF